VLNIDLGFNTWLYHESVRLQGIDCAEVRTRDLEEKKEGLKAKARVEELCTPGLEVILQSTEHRSGKYGRVIGHILVPLNDNDDGVDVSEVLVDEGLAVRI
jgi:endonuclease YncB( thermonuclease family)